jgi:NADH-quinone oxidoreductase subunit G/NADP-reducing hydrogenase subunit HndD
MVSVMPCTAKKFESERTELAVDGLPDVDAVLTTRELARVIKMRGLDLKALAPEPSDSLFGERSSAGKLFGTSGGVMEAAIRTAYFLLTGEELPIPKIQELRGADGVKTFHHSIGGTTYGFASVSGLGNARRLLEEIKRGRGDIHFIEVMTCPGGCIAGGGQPLSVSQSAVRARMKTLYEIDADARVKTSHGNEGVKKLYREFLGEPLGEKSHRLLHTHYHTRNR